MGAEVEAVGDMEEDSRKFKAVGNMEEDSRRFILSFNVDDEKFHQIKLPERNLRKKHSECLAVLKGSLAFIGFSLADSRSGTCFIWVIKEFGVLDSNMCINGNGWT